MRSPPHLARLEGCHIDHRCLLEHRLLGHAWCLLGWFK